MNPSNPVGYYIPPMNGSIAQPPLSVQNQPTFLPTQNLLPELDFQSDALNEPITKCKVLYDQLKSSLQVLLNLLNSILNPSSSSPNVNDRLNAENQFQQFGKSVENFNRVCDLLIVNLRVACEAQTTSIEIKQYSRYYNHANQLDHDMSILPLINIQMQRINEFKTLFQRFLTNNPNSNQ